MTRGAKAKIKIHKVQWKISEPIQFILYLPIIFMLCNNVIKCQKMQRIVHTHLKHAGVYSDIADDCRDDRTDFYIQSRPNKV